MGMHSQLAASYPCAIYAWNLQFAQRWRLCKQALKIFRKIGDPRQCLLKLIGRNCCSSYKYREAVPWLRFTWNWNWKNNLWSFLRKSCHVLAVGVLEITTIFNRDSDIQIFLNGDILLNGSWIELDGTLKWSRGRTVVERYQRSLTIRIEKTLDMWTNCVLKQCLSLKTFIPNFVAFFVSLRIVISCIHKMSFSVT